MIVPISVGSVTDVAARLTAQELQRGSASRSSSSTSRAPPWCSAAANAPSRRRTATRYAWSSPDTMSFNPLTVPNLPYDPDKDFVPVIDMYHVMEGMMVPAALERRHARCAACQGRGCAGQAQLRHARRAHHHRRVPPVARRTLAHQLRRHSVQGRQRDHQRAARRTPSTSPRSASATWSASSGAGKIKMLALNAAQRAPRLAQCADFQGSRARRISRRSDLLGRGRAYRHAGADRRAPARRIGGDLPRPEVPRFRQAELSSSRSPARPANSPPSSRRTAPDAKVWSTNT